MKLYCTPGGTWAGSMKDYKDAMKAEGSDPKTAPRSQIDVPTSKAELMEFLTFHGVNPISPTRDAPIPTPAAAPFVAPATTVPNAGPVDLDDLFDAAPLARQLHLASLACENARASIK